MWLYLYLLINLLSSNNNTDKMARQELPTVPVVDIQRYAGTWYEIARLPNSFEKDIKCITATYTLDKPGKISVLNQGRKISNPAKLNSIKGYARIPDAKYPGRLKVTFFWPFAGDYYIIDLDKDYQYALVGAPSRKYLWILSRNPKIDPALYDQLIKKAQTLGFETAVMIKNEQDCQ
jgi:apolipoprotein D and lipocalin family protein